MPYTTEQLQAASTRFRNILSGHMPDAIAVLASLSHLAECEAVNRNLRDELTGELIVGEPLTVYEGMASCIAGCRRGWDGELRSVFRSYPVGAHHFANEENARAAGWMECAHCGVWFHPDHDSEYEIVNGDAFCSTDCISEYGYYTCEYCGDWVHEDDALYACDYYYCDDSCAERNGLVLCDRCEEWHSEDDTRTVYNGGDAELWCSGCVDYAARWCDSCEEYHHEDDVCYDDESGMDLCDDCRDNGRRRHADELHEYGWQPYRLEFYSLDGYDRFAKKQPRFYGVELETDGGSDRDAYVSRLAETEGFSEHFWMTRDSSLCDGVEITGHPMTLSYHMSLAPLYCEISKAAREFGFKSHDGGRCGLHIHVNRNSFGRDKRLQDVAAYKMMRLLQRFERAFTIFTRRTENSWCSYTTSYRGDYKLDDTPKASRNGKSEDGVLQAANKMECDEKSHSQCINFEHSNTFEFRIFRGTLKWSTYFASLALVDGLCETAMRHGSTWVEGVTWYDLVDEVVANVSDDTARMCLVNYLSERGLR